MRILSIDIGILNLGYVYADITPPPSLTIRILDVKRVDLTQLRHRRVPRCRCRLRHDKHVSSRVLHFIQEHEPYFEDSDLILTEQQPPMGLTSIEAIFHTRYYHKVRSISPTALHRYYGIRHLEYDDRKQFILNLAHDRLSSFDSYTSQRRRHDMADALVFIYFFFRRDNARGWKSSEPAKVVSEEEVTDDTNPFSKFAYDGPLLA